VSGGVLHAGIALGVNIDHVATLRQARRGRYPDPVYAALIAEEAGADSITLHLREDRRHIQDRDVTAMRESLQTRMNLEMAVTDEMIRIAQKVLPQDCCLVPESRQEITTEGGLDAVAQHNVLAPVVAKLVEAGIRVSLFIAADPRQIELAARIRAPAIEIHTGAWCEAIAGGHHASAETEWVRIREGARLAHGLGLEVHAGHGLNFASAEAIATIPEIVELNIGHFLVGEAIDGGLAAAVATMRAAMDRGRARIAS